MRPSPLQTLILALCLAPLVDAQDLPVYQGTVPSITVASAEWLGPGTTGIQGEPQLQVGLQAVGSPFAELRLSQGAPSALALLLYGDQVGAQPLLDQQGILYTAGSLGSFPVILDAEGSATDFGQPQGAVPASASGLSLVLQAAIQDPAATGGWALTPGWRQVLGAGRPVATRFPSAAALVDGEGMSEGGVALGDIDGDGIADAVCTRGDGHLTLCLGDAAGRLTPVAVMTIPVAPAEQVLLGDVNGDGRQDLIARTGASLTTRLTGPGVLLGPPGQQVSPIPLGHATLVDLGADGTQELLACVPGGSPRLALFPGRPGGGFDPVVPLDTVLRYERLAHGDFDGDGLQDVVGLAEGGTEALGYFRGRADGSLEPEQFSALGGVDGTKDLVVSRVGLDHRDDVIVLGPGLAPGANSALVLVPGSPIGLGPDALIAEFNGFTRFLGMAGPHVVAATHDTLRVIRKEPLGLAFTVDEPVALRAANALATGRLGPVDQAVLLDQYGQLTRRRVNGNAFEAEPFASAGWAEGLADLDGDGRPELVTRSAFELSWIDDPDDPATAHATVVSNQSGHFDVAVGDVTGDGLPDLLAIPTSTLAPGGPVLLRANLGAAQFATPVEVPGVGTADTLRLADLNGDDVLDILWLGFSTASTVLSDGSGGFSDTGWHSTTPQPLDIATGDVDGDGHLDLVMATGDLDHTDLYLGLGDGTFAAPIASPTSLACQGVSLADVDGDGLADRIGLAPLAPTTAADGLRLEVALSLGDGTFLTVGTHATPPHWRDVQAADLDADGQLDLVLGGLGGPIVLPGLGNGGFGPAVPFVGLGGRVVVGDVDLDGDLDLISGDGDSTSSSGVHQLTLVRQLGTP